MISIRALVVLLGGLQSDSCACFCFWCCRLALGQKRESSLDFVSSFVLFRIAMHFRRYCTTFLLCAMHTIDTIAGTRIL